MKRKPEGSKKSRKDSIVPRSRHEAKIVKRSEEYFSEAETAAVMRRLARPDLTDEEYAAMMSHRYEELFPEDD